MRFPRFTIRWMMVLVAVVAVMAWGGTLYQGSLASRSKATSFERKAKDFRVSACDIYQFEMVEQRLGRKLGIDEEEFWKTGRFLSCKLIVFEVSAAEQEASLQAATKEVASKGSPIAKKALRFSAHYFRLKDKYERAARYPWLLVEHDPPEPK